MSNILSRSLPLETMLGQVNRITLKLFGSFFLYLLYLLWSLQYSQDIQQVSQSGPSKPFASQFTILEYIFGPHFVIVYTFMQRIKVQVYCLPLGFQSYISQITTFGKEGWYTVYLQGFNPILVELQPLFTHTCIYMYTEHTSLLMVVISYLVYCRKIDIFLKYYF